VNADSKASRSSGAFRSLIGLAVVSLLLFLAVAGLATHRELAAAQARKQALEERIAETRQRNEDLRVEVELLESNAATLERLAREEYRMAYPEDVIIVIGEDSAPEITPEN
jgi:cell division protein FtsB